MARLKLCWFVLVICILRPMLIRTLFMTWRQYRHATGMEPWYYEGRGLAIVLPWKWTEPSYFDQRERETFYNVPFERIVTVYFRMVPPHSVAYKPGAYDLCFDTFRCPAEVDTTPAPAELPPKLQGEQFVAVAV